MSALGEDDFANRQWVRESGRRLGREEFQLLKALYSNTLGLWRLQYEVKEPQDHALLLYQIPLEQGAPSLSGDDRVHERSRLTPRQSLALFVHRLQILVPTSDRLEAEDTRNMGAKDCLSSMESMWGRLLTMEEIEISQESKLMECLVKSYVNITTGQRSELKRQVAGLVGLNAESSTVFDVFAELFVKRHDPKEIVTMFTRSMTLARCYPSGYVELQENLSKSSIPHQEIHIPDEPLPEPAITSPMKKEIEQIIKTDKREQRRHRKRKVLICITLFLLFFLDLLAGAITIGIFSNHRDEKHVVEDDSWKQQYGPLTKTSSEIAPILVTKFNTFWCKKVTLQQLTEPYLQLTLYKLPASHLKVYTTQLSLNGTGNFVINEQGLYLLEGSSMTFNLRINSIDPSKEGFVVFPLFSSYKASSDEKAFAQYNFSVKPGEKNKVFSISLTARWNAYYYMYTHGSNAVVDSYHIAFQIRFLNYSDWTGKKYTTFTSDGKSPLSLFENPSFSSMMAAEDYVIVANITNPYPAEGGYPGQLKVQQYKRTLVYVVPAIASLGGIAVLVTFLILACICYCIIRKTKQRRSESSELNDPLISSTSN